MRKTLKVFVTLILVITLSLISVNVIFADQGKAPEQVRIIAGTVGGEWFQIGAIVSEIFRKAGAKTSLEVGGGNSNIININKQNAELSFSMGISIAKAREAEAPFTEKYTDVMSLGFLYEQVVTVVVTEDSGITSIEQLKGKKFASQPEGSSNQAIFADILKVYGLTEDDLDLSRGGLAEQNSLLRDRHVVGSTNAFQDLSYVEEINISVPLRILPIPTEKFEELSKINNAYAKAEHSWKGETIPTVSTYTYLIVNRNMPEDEVYWMTKTLVENIQEIRDFKVAFKDLTAEDMSKEVGIKLHPGARKYYEEIGIVFD